MVEVCFPVFSPSIGDVSIRRADYWLVEVAPRQLGYSPMFRFQSAGRIIGWLKEPAQWHNAKGYCVSIRRADYWLVEARQMLRLQKIALVSIRRADYWLVEEVVGMAPNASRAVSIRRADYWLVEAGHYVDIVVGVGRFQSAGRIIGWLKNGGLGS